MGKKGEEQKIRRGKKRAFWYAALFFIYLLCPACAQSTSTGGSQEPPAAETEVPSGAGTEEPSSAETEAPLAVADVPPVAETEVPFVSETEPPAPKTEEPAIEATEAPAAGTKELPIGLPAELREVLEYNGIPVRVYKMEKYSSKAGYASRAEFEFEGIPYELYDFGRNDEEHVKGDIEELIGLICREREENPESILADVFGNEEYRVRIDFGARDSRHWHYYVEREKGMECVAERYGSVISPFEAYSIDIDNDGRKELICNCESTRGRVYIFREKGGVIEKGWWDTKGYAEEYGLNSTMTGPYEDWYDPEQGMFVVTYFDWETKERRADSFWGLEHLEFSEFSHDDR